MSSRSRSALPVCCDVVRVCVQGFVMLPRLARIGPSTPVTLLRSLFSLPSSKVAACPASVKSVVRTVHVSQVRRDIHASTAGSQRDTIAALSSGSGRCGVALLRVSGPLAGWGLINTSCFLRCRHSQVTATRRRCSAQGAAVRKRSACGETGGKHASLRLSCESSDDLKKCCKTSGTADRVQHTPSRDPRVA